MTKQSTFLPAPSVADQLRAAAKAKERKGGHEPAGGLFSDDAKQADLVDQARRTHRTCGAHGVTHPATATCPLCDLDNDESVNRAAVARMMLP